MSIAITPMDTDEIGRLTGWWNALAGGDVPRRERLEPAAILPFLPHVALAEVPPGAPAEARLRLVGTRLCRLLGHDPTGRALREIVEGPLLVDFVSGLREAVERGRPVYARRLFQVLGFEHGFERLLLPFRWRGEGNDLVLAALYPTERAWRSDKDWRAAIARRAEATRAAAAPVTTPFAGPLGA